MQILIPGLALAPELYYSGYPQAQVVDPWLTSWTNATSYFPLSDDDEPCTLIGHSLGGLVALEWALLHPNRIAKLILLDPTFPELSPVHIPISNATTAFITPVLAPLVGLGLSSFLDRSLIRARYRNPRHLQFLYREWASSSELQSRLAQLLTTNKIADHISVDLLVGAGDGNERTFLTEQETLAKMLNIHPTWLWGQGHLFPITRSDLVNPFISPA